MSTRELLKQAYLGIKKANEVRIPASVRADTYASFFRKKSLEATHTLDISYKLVYNEVLRLITRDGIQITGANIGYEEMAKLISEALSQNIRNAASIPRRGYTITVVGDLLTVTSGVNNFEAIRQIVNQATDTLAYQIGPFIEKVLEEYGAKVTIIDPKLKAGFDLGHLKANVVHSIETAMFNTLSRSKEVKALRDDKGNFKNVDVIKEDLTRLQALLSDPASINELLNLTGNKAIRQEILEASASIVVDFLRTYVDGKVEAVLKSEPVLDRTVITRVAKQLTYNLVLQDATFNQTQGASIEKAITNQLLVLSDKTLTSVLNRITGKMGSEIIDLHGSPSIKEDVTEGLAYSLRTGKPYTVKRKSKATTKKTKKPINVPVRKVKKVPHTRVSNAIKIPVIRDLKGRFMSILTLQAILENLPEKVEENMGRGFATDRLNLQSGRFASSVEATKVMSTREGAIQVFYTYQKYPYQTFEPGFRQGNLGRDPRTLIEGSIRELLQPYVRNAIMTIRE